MATTLRNYLDAQFPSDPDTTRANGQRQWFEAAMIGATQVIHTVNNTDVAADWTESDSGTWDVTADSTDERVTGSGKASDNHIVMVNTAACDGTQYIETRLIQNNEIPTLKHLNGTHYEDWRDTDYVGFWLAAQGAAGFDTAGEADLRLVYLNGAGDEVVGSAVNFPAAVNNVHQRAELDISGYGENRAKVVALRVYATNSVTGQGIEIDSIIRYKHGNGKGPVYGRCIKLPITGTNTVARGDIVQLDVATTAGMGVSLEAAAAVNTFGVVVEGGTGTAAGNVYATVQYDGLIYLRASAATVAGEALIWESAGHVEGVATGVTQNAFAKCYEAAGAAEDDIACQLISVAPFIS